MSHLEEPFRNREQYGFLDNGHLYGIDGLVRAYVGENQKNIFTDDELRMIENHIIACEYCDRLWDEATDRIFSVNKDKFRDN